MKTTLLSVILLSLVSIGPYAYAERQACVDMSQPYKTLCKQNKRILRLLRQGNSGNQGCECRPQGGGYDGYYFAGGEWVDIDGPGSVYDSLQKCLKGINGGNSDYEGVCF